MDEYAALAQRFVLSMTDVRGCLVLSRDGLVLGAYPEEDETIVKPPWRRFVTLGEVRKSFVELSDQIWAYVYRGPYAMFVVAGVSVRPGILIDQLEQALITAEEGRTKRDPLKVPDAAAAPTGKPRTPLHPQADREPASVAEGVAAEPVHDRRLWSMRPAAALAATGQTEPGTGWPRPSQAADAPSATPAPEVPPLAPTAEELAAEQARSALKREPQRLVSSERGSGDDGADEPGEIDRVLLAKEFSGLLQVDRDPDEGSS